MSLLWILLTILLNASVVPAAAATTAKKGNDGNVVVITTTTTSFCIDAFTHADANEDNYLSLQEFQQGWQDLLTTTTTTGAGDNHDNEHDDNDLSGAAQATEEDCSFLLHHHVFYSIACLCWNDPIGGEEQQEDKMSVKKKVHKQNETPCCCPTTTTMNKNDTQQQQQQPLLVRLPMLNDAFEADLADQFCEIVQDGIKGKFNCPSDEAYIAMLVSLSSSSSSSSLPTEQSTAMTTPTPTQLLDYTIVPSVAPTTGPMTNDFDSSSSLSASFTDESTVMPSFALQANFPVSLDTNDDDDDDNPLPISQMPEVGMPIFTIASSPSLFAPATNEHPTLMQSISPTTMISPTMPMTDKSPTATTQTPTGKDGIHDNDESTIQDGSIVSAPSTEPVGGKPNNSEEREVQRVILGSVLGFLAVCALFLVGIIIIIIIYTRYHCKQQRKMQIAKLKAETVTIPTIISIPSSKTSDINIPTVKDGCSIVVDLVDIERNY